jgi:hypothetical protein
VEIAGAARSRVHRLVDTCTATPRRASGLLFLFVVATRGWLLDSGFGWDQDAWQVANSGYWLAFAHQHILSRRPGYPLDEFLLALFMRIEAWLHGPGWIVTNAFTILVFALQCVLFYRLARRAGARGALLLVAAYSLHPVVFDQSVGSLDVHLPLLLILWAVDRLMVGRWVQAAVAFGIAMAARVTIGIMIVPFVWYLWKQTPSWRRAAAFAAIGLAIAVPFYAGTLLRYRSASLPIPIEGNPIKAWIMMGLYRTLGIDAAIALLAAVLTARRSLWTAVVRRADRVDRFLVLGMAVHVVFFAVKPYDGAYLVPAMPFLLILLGRHAHPKAVAAFLVVLILNGFVSAPGVRRDATGRAVGLQAWAKGEMFERMDERWRKRHLPETIARQGLEPHTALVVGGLGSTIWFHERAAILAGRRFEVIGGGIPRFTKPFYDRDADVYYVPAWEVDLAVALVGRGYTLRELPGIRTADVVGLRAAIARLH